MLSLTPDLILDTGTINDTYVSLADRVQAQTGIPYALLDGSFAGTPGAYRTLGELVGRKERAEELAASCETTIRTVLGRIHGIPDDRRPRVYYARGPRGLETGLGGSINVETIEVLRARNVAGEVRGGLATVSLEQVLAWAPEVIVTIDADFYANVRSDPAWSGVPAVRSGRVHLSPKLPFGWVDFPPSVNRFIGLWWLAKILYPDRFPEESTPIARDFYTRFYHVTPTDEQLERVLAGRDEGSRAGATPASGARPSAAAPRRRVAGASRRRRRRSLAGTRIPRPSLVGRFPALALREILGTSLARAQARRAMRPSVRRPRRGGGGAPDPRPARDRGRARRRRRSPSPAPPSRACSAIRSSPPTSSAPRRARRSAPSSASIFSLGVVGIQLLAFVGGLARRRRGLRRRRLPARRRPVLVLVLAGVVIGALLGAGVGLVKYLADPYDQLPP